MNLRFFLWAIGAGVGIIFAIVAHPLASIHLGWNIYIFLVVGVVIGDQVFEFIEDEQYRRKRFQNHKDPP